MKKLLFVLVVAAACKKSEDHAPAAKVTTGSAKNPNQIDPPLDLKNPPADAIKRPSGLVYKTITAAPDGALPQRNDTVMIKYTGWRQASGETFFSNMKEDKPMPLNLAVTARGFTEGMQLVHKGETAMLWLPPEIGLKKPTSGKPAETLVYLVEVVDIVPAPPVPADVAAPPADAKTTKSGVKYVVVREGTGKDRARSVDQVTFNVTAWNSEGRMFDTTEMKKKPEKPPAKVAPFRQPAPMEEILTSMVAGERVRFWVDSAKMHSSAAPQQNMPEGLLCYEVEVLQIDPAAAVPPPPPPDVAKPPGDAHKTASGLAYKVLATGKGGPKPKATDQVSVNYTGWTTDGRMFDSSVLNNKPTTFSLNQVIKGWTEGLQLMSVGDRYRFWVPFELAYKGQPSRPQGMLVFEIELVDVKEPAAPTGGPPGPPRPPHPPLPGHP
jgi:FKBP-type peptidyl-prolyl cis-trans isomerase